MSEFEGFGQDDPRAGDSSVEMPTDKEVEETAAYIASLPPEDRDMFIADLKKRLPPEWVESLWPETLEPQSKDAHLEEKVVALPALMTASELLDATGDDDPNAAALAALPQEPADEDTPPDDAVPPFRVVPKAGQGVPSVYLADGTPVGVWLHTEHPDLDGAHVQELLTLQGLDPGLAKWYGKQRDGAIEATKSLSADPRVASFAQEESERVVRKKAVQAAYLETMKKKAKQS